MRQPDQPDSHDWPTNPTTWHKHAARASALWQPAHDPQQSFVAPLSLSASRHHRPAHARRYATRAFVLAAVCALFLAPLLALRDLSLLGPMSTVSVRTLAAVNLHKET